MAVNHKPPPPQPQRTRPLRAAAEQAMATTLRLRGSPEAPERATRSASGKLGKSQSQPKLKLKLSERAAAQAPGMSFLGPYDRELDSDDDDLTFEEQFIIRMPPGDDSERLRKMIQSREIGTTCGSSSKLVDLPCIIEAQKTLDNKQMFKVADICQANRNVNIDEFIWPHGTTPPLHHVRKRRFRKRVNKRTIESVEEEVERLLAADNLASEVKYDVLDNVNPDLSDSEFIEREEPLEAPTPGPQGSEAGDIATPGADAADEEAEEGEEAEQEGDIDEELAAELDLALGDDEEGEDEDEDEDEDEEESDDDDDDDDAQGRKLLNEEIRDLEAAVAKKEHEVSISGNPLIKKRFEDALKKLSADLEMKRAQRDEMKERQRRKKEGIAVEDPDTDAEGGPQDVVEVEASAVQPDGDLFGSDEPNAMDIG
ncbi:hypothetical protein JVU11DRAFT_951 [Chiua virens]|nr:hypothetical protein JVU11DRAFT_951 [Chiua virens]